MAKAQQRKPDSAVMLLKDEHRQVEQLFKRFEQLGARAHKTKRSVVDKVIEALSVHAAIEEVVFYPAIRERLPDATGDVLEALEEHHLVKLTLSELERLDADDERFTAKMTVLMENVRHHVREEEQQLFPQVRSEFTRAELGDLGEALRSAKRTAPKRPHPHSPDTPPGNVVASALVAPIDAARSAVRSVTDAGS